MAKRPCATPGCPVLTPRGTSYCLECARRKDKERGTRQARGYDANHDAERTKWVRIINAGGWPCARCERRIQPGEAFHLDHNDARTGYLGPSCPNCNLSAAGKAAHRTPSG